VPYRKHTENSINNCSETFLEISNQVAEKRCSTRTPRQWLWRLFFNNEKRLLKCIAMLYSPDILVSKISVTTLQFYIPPPDTRRHWMEHAKGYFVVFSWIAIVFPPSFDFQTLLHFEDVNKFW